MVSSAFFFFFLITEPIWSSLQFFLSFFFFFFVLHHRTHLVFATGGDGGDRRRPDRRYINSSFVQVQSSLHQFWICAGLIVAASILGLWRSDCHCRSDCRCGYWGLKEKKRGMLGAAANYGRDHHRGREMWESLLGFIYSVLHASGSKFFFSFAEAGMVFYERQSESWRLDQGKVRRSEAGRLIEIIYGGLWPSAQ